MSYGSHRRDVVDRVRSGPRSDQRAAQNPAVLHATLCHDCGAELGKPSDLMRHECPIGIARAIRLGNRKDISPSHLHALCRGDAGLFTHAMREAGYIVQKATGKPEDPCSTCGWSPTLGVAKNEEH